MMTDEGNNYWLIIITSFKLIHIAKIFFFEDEIRIRELERVMDIYIPNAVLRHHKALYETRNIIPGYVFYNFLMY